VAITAVRIASNADRCKKYVIVDVAGVCKPYGRHVTMTSQLQVDRWVEGVALFEDKIFVVYDQCDVMSVYRQDGLETLGAVKVGGLQLPNDLVCCNESRQLYVADLSHCVWRVSIDNYRVKKWIPNRRAPEDFSPLSLSVRSRQVMSSVICNIVDFSAVVSDKIEDWTLSEIVYD